MAWKDHDATTAAAEALPPLPAPPAQDLQGLVHEGPGERGESPSPAAAAAAEVAAAATAERKGEKVAATSPSSASCLSRFMGSSSPMAEDAGVVVDVMRPSDLKNIFNTMLREQKAINDMERQLVEAGAMKNQVERQVLSTCSLLEPKGDHLDHEEKIDEQAAQKLGDVINRKDEEIWKLRKRIEELEKASIPEDVAEEKTQATILEITEKYEKQLMECMEREEKLARRAALLNKVLREEKIKHDNTRKELQQLTDKKQLEEPRIKVDDVIHQIMKVQKLVKSGLAAVVRKENHSLIEEPSELCVPVLDAAVSEDDEHIRQTMKMVQKITTSELAAVAKEKQYFTEEPTQLNWVSASDSGTTMDPKAEVKNIQQIVDEVEVLNAMLIRRLEEAKHAIKMRSYDDAQVEELETDLVAAIKKCHDVFICPHEDGHVKLIDYIASEGNKIFRVRSVPGKVKECDLPEHIRVRTKKYIVPARRGRNSNAEDLYLKKLDSLGKFVAAGLTECGFRLHRNGICLAGRFSLKNVYVTANRRIKLGAEVKCNVLSRVGNRRWMNLDYFTIHDILVQIASLSPEGLPVSFDLKCLLDLLSSEDPVGKEILIRYNPSLMDEIQKREHFITMFKRWDQLGRHEKGTQEYAKSRQVLKYIKAADNDDWRDCLHENMFTSGVRGKHVNDSGEAKNDAECLLETWRHNFTHLHEVTNEIKDEDQVDIMDSIKEGVINQLQEGMHAVGELEIPHLVHTMRM